MKPLIYSAGFKLPKIKPPRLDLRNRPKHTPQAPAKPKPPVDKPKDPLRATDFAFNRANDFYEGFTTTGFITEWDEPIERPEPLVDDGREVYMIFNEEDWVFTQATAVASVNVTKDREWQITEDTIKYVNSNGNSWETKYLLGCYKTFKGAMNLKDHVSPAEGGLVYGMIIDAVPRKIKTETGDWVVYIDCIIATNKHIDPQWADAIRRGTVRYLSVGFDCNYLTCSRCGHIYLVDNTGICQHCMFDLGLKYWDELGRKSVTSAMISNVDGADNTGEFVELSYLSVNPAGEMCVKSHNIEFPKGVTSTKILMPRISLKKPAYQALKQWIKVKKIEPQQTI